jgi:hypothetical protein
MTVQRVILFLGLAIFPATMILLVTYGAGTGGRQIVFMETLIILLVGLVGLLSLLLSASTGVYSELEGKSWVYVACRPSGRISTIFGKFLAAVILSYSVSLLAATLAVVAAQLGGGLPMFTLIGTLFYRRAMVFCAAYIIVVEFMLANVPALIRSFTIRCHLQELAILGYGWIMPLREEPYRLIYGEFPLWLNVLALVLFIGLALGISAFFVIRQEFITADET